MKLAPTLDVHLTSDPVASAGVTFRDYRHYPPEAKLLASKEGHHMAYRLEGYRNDPLNQTRDHA